jgi:S1-C subfamily serine protease
VRRLAALAMVCAATLTACASDDADNPPPDVSASTVGVLATGCGPTASAGSGVALGQPGQIVTVAHTVAGSTSITVVDAAGSERPARVVAIDTAADLAVLSVVDFTAPPLVTGDVALGDATAHRWSRDSGVGDQSVEVTKRLAITIDDIYGEQSAQRSGIEIAGDVQVGDSGGPIVTLEGAVIGIVYARSRLRASTGFATDTIEIERVLATASPDAVDTGRCV